MDFLTDQLFSNVFHVAAIACRAGYALSRLINIYLFMWDLGIIQLVFPGILLALVRLDLSGRCRFFSGEGCLIFCFIKE